LIYIDGHPGVLDVEDVMAARDGAMAAELDADAVFGEVEALRVDGRNAWGWYERIESPRRGLVEVTYRAVVPYDSVTYAIEFVSGEPSLKRASPDTLREVVSTFAIGRTTYDLPVILVVLGGMVFVVSVLRSRSKEKADRLRSINLVTVQREEDDETASGPDVAPEAYAAPGPDEPPGSDAPAERDESPAGPGDSAAPPSPTSQEPEGHRSPGGGTSIP
jgi:hypothetical protein